MDSQVWLIYTIGFLGFRMARLKKKNSEYETGLNPGSEYEF